MDCRVKPGNDEIGQWTTYATLPTNLLWHSCSSRRCSRAASSADSRPWSISGDDDAFCRASHAAGSPEYVACRKDRDVQRANANARADKRQRNLGEYMLNNPTRP